MDSPREAGGAASLLEALPGSRWSLDLAWVGSGELEGFVSTVLPSLVSVSVTLILKAFVPALKFASPRREWVDHEAVSTSPLREG